MKLNVQQRLALGRRWILRPVLNAVKIAGMVSYAVHWTQQVKRHCEQPGDGANLCSCLDLAESIGMSRGNFSRYFPLYDGTYDLKPKVQMPDPMLRYRVSIALGVSDENLSPDLRLWIAETVKWLGVMRQRVSYRDPSTAHLAFADYLLVERDDDHRDCLCEPGAQHALRQHQCR